MKEFIKLSIVGLAGYFVGFYEYKYKTQKALLEVLIEEKKNKKEEEEAQ